MDLNFNDAKIDGGASKYIAPGICQVKIKEVKSGTSSVKGSPYVEVVVEDNYGAVASNQYYLNTNPGPSGRSAWDISKNALYSIVLASTGLDTETVKTKLSGATGAEDLAKKITTLTADKSFRMKLKGKAVFPQDTTKHPFIKTIFANGCFVESLNTEPSTLRFNSDTDIEKLPQKTQTSDMKVNDLPW